MRVVRGFGIGMLSLVIMALLFMGVLTDYRDDVSAPLSVNRNIDRRPWSP